jgi:sodium transport system permease protein
VKANDPAILVYRKEMREMLRDKRVRVSAFVMPIVIIFMMVTMMGVIMSSIGGKSKQKVYVVQTSNPLVKALQASPALEVAFLASEQDGLNLIKQGKARLVLTITQKSPTGPITVKEQYDSKEDTGEIAKATVERSLKPFADQFEAQKLASVGLTESEVQPIVYKDSPVQVGETGASTFIVGFLPYLLVLFSFSGGINFAGDIVAGEKEKSTLETLLISPVPRTQIVLGKFLSLCTICLASALCSLLGLVLASVLKIGGTGEMFSGGFGLTPKSVGILLLLIIPMVAFFGGALIAVSSYARNNREAQTYLGMVYLVVLLPAVSSQLIGFTDMASSTWINFVPILNTAANMRATFQGKASALGIGETVTESVVLAAIMIAVAIRLFNREQVLDRT